ncbi:neuronal acetylcholine receptor subunit non-alpha-2-like [Periplaneta americana]|uniref:neuronal acetylcholine receptor subunit non-alpha-2-like n=1 Tax=Periplaneta americana TaxID=6978 RepID=UPI0037E8DD93
MTSPVHSCVFILYLFTVYIYCAQSVEETCTVPKTKIQTLRLKQDLLCNYDKKLRPADTRTKATKVVPDMFLKSLTYDDEHGILNVHSFTLWFWKDERLSWKPSEYENINFLVMSTDEIWVPEVARLVPSMMRNMDKETTGIGCYVYSNGYVTCSMVAVYAAVCALDSTHWPYDSLNCSFRLGSWREAGDDISLSLYNKRVHQSKYEPNEWKLLSATSTIRLDLLEHNATLPWVEYRFTLQRHSFLPEVIVGAPVLVNAIMVLLNFVFLSASDDKRITFSCVILICHCIYLQYLGMTLGNTGESSPIVVRLYRDSLVLLGVSLVVTIALRCLSSSTDPPTCIQNLTNRALSYRVGQLVVLMQISRQVTAVAKDETDEDDGLIVTSSPDRDRVWVLFCKIVDRICFVVYSLWYLVLFLRWTA